MLFSLLDDDLVLDCVVFPALLPEALRLPVSVSFTSDGVELCCVVELFDWSSEELVVLLARVPPLLLLLLLPVVSEEFSSSDCSLP